MSMAETAESSVPYVTPSELFDRIHGYFNDPSSPGTPVRDANGKELCAVKAGVVRGADIETLDGALVVIQHMKDNGHYNVHVDHRRKQWNFSYTPEEGYYAAPEGEQGASVMEGQYGAMAYMLDYLEGLEPNPLALEFAVQTIQQHGRIAPGIGLVAVRGEWEA
ncbi:MAG TPA: hypothetical protein VLE73_05845 [Candidatus Saccharimonadales bacterium]|nr:hypothetical protein [Candidatus Saccharimonadales bacterium]